MKSLPTLGQAAVTGMPVSVATSPQLPTTIELRPGEALDGYLERVAEANYLTTAWLMAALNAGTDTTCCLMLAPTPRTLAVLNELTCTGPQRLRQATLAVYDGLWLDLTGLDPARPASFRTVSARGWVPGRGTQICPICLAETGMWSLAWRLPSTTVCCQHGTYLLSTCPGCGRRFRDQHHSHLRVVGAATCCGNPLGQGPRAQCDVDLSALRPPVADVGCLARQEHQNNVHIGRPVGTAFGELPGREYCSSLRALTILLLHIATATTETRGLPAWVSQLAQEQKAKAPRWGIRPPTDIILRSRALTTANEIIKASDIDHAIERFDRWFDAVPPVPEGRLGWLADHTTMTPTVTRLVTSAYAPGRRVSRLLDTKAQLTRSLRLIPQVLPSGPYQRHLRELYASRPDTVRVFAALSIARTHPAVGSWTDAAAALGLPEDLGTATVRACSVRRNVPVPEVVAAITVSADELDGRDYRALEDQIRRLTRTRGWFTRWTCQQQDGLPTPGRDTAILWLWVHCANAHPRTAPILTAQTLRPRTSRVRRSLTFEQQRSLIGSLHNLRKPHQPRRAQ